MSKFKYKDRLIETYRPSYEPFSHLGKLGHEETEADTEVKVLVQI